MRSMTGFAREQLATAMGQLVLEIRSVNQRFLDVHFQLYEPLRYLEPLMRQRLNNQLWRGKVEISVRLRINPMNTQHVLHEAQLEKLRLWLISIQKYIPDLNPPTTLDILRSPGVMQETEPDLTVLAEQTLILFDQGLDSLIQTRTREGEHLAKLLKERLQAIQQVLNTIQNLLPQLLQQQQRQLVERAQKLNLELEAQRLASELALLVQKADIHEELDRIRGHIAEVEQQIASSIAVGRRLDFLMQELNREANTLAAKASDNRLIHAGVELKVLIEQMREQVQNIE